MKYFSSSSTFKTLPTGLNILFIRNLYMKSRIFRVQLIQENVKPFILLQV